VSDLKLLKNPFFWLVMLASLVWAAVIQLPDNQLHLVFCDVGQGDAILVSHRFTQVLIDGGPNNQVMDCLSENLPFWDRKIEMVVATHPDADHITGLVEVAKRYQVDYFLLNSSGKDSAVFTAFREAVDQESARVHFPKIGDYLQVGPAQIAVLWPESQGKVLGETTMARGANETSTVFKLSYGQFDALFPGDIGLRTEALLELDDIEVLKVAHHGSKHSTGDDFLSQVKPELAIISVGKNSFGHPTIEVLERLENFGSRVLRTDQLGSIEIVTNGEQWRVKDNQVN
jgi:competence protein ComEC